MEITRTSMFTGVTRTLSIPVTEAQLQEWQNGSLIQKAMPELTADEREFIMTGVTPDEWDNEFRVDDEDQIHPCKGKLQS